MRIHEIYTNERDAQTFPTRTFRELFHVGSMKIEQKQDGIYEGAGLSVSVNPEEWKKIARGHVRGRTWRCTKPNNKFLDFHKLSQMQKDNIVTWGLKTGFATSGTTWRVTFYDDDDEPYYMEFPNREQAEYETNDEEDITAISDGLFPTPLYHQRTRSKDKTVDFGLLVTLYVEDATDLDGVWWQDVLDVSRFSAPRGVIVPQKINEWIIEASSS